MTVNTNPNFNIPVIRPWADSNSYSAPAYWIADQRPNQLSHSRAQLGEQRSSQLFITLEWPLDPFFSDRKLYIFVGKWQLTPTRHYLTVTLLNNSVEFICILCLFINYLLHWSGPWILFLVIESYHKLNFIPLKHLFLLMIYMFHLPHFNTMLDF